MKKLNEEKSSSIIYQKVLNSDYEFVVKAVTGDDYKNIDAILMSKDYVVIRESYTPRFASAQELANRTEHFVRNENVYLHKFDTLKTLKVIFAYPENGMYITEQRQIVYKTLELLNNFAKENCPNCNTIEAIYVTNSPFVITDITIGNVTVLLDEKMHAKHEGAFMGNLYDVCSGMLSKDDCCFVGRIAMDFCNYLIDAINEKNIEKDTAKKMTNFIDDSFIRGSLLNNIDENFNK